MWNRSFEVALALCAVLAGCGGEVTSSRSGALGSTSAENASGGGGMVGANAAGTSNAGSAGTSTVGAPPVKYDCLRDDIGASAPEQFVELHYEIQSCAGQGSDCVDFLNIRADCSLSFQYRDVSHDATSAPDDCAALARWATSDVLGRALDDLPACSPGPGNPPELTEIQLVSGPGPRKKTGLCPDEPYVSHRACMASVRAKYFPGI